ncbi:MAG: hypothetical protein ABIQ17_04200 [Candidatus Limnocylindrales bacterium]
MDLVAGDAREILLAIGTDDLASLDDRTRFRAHLALGGGLDPTWLDLFSEAVRTVTGRDEPVDFLDARLELEGPGPDEDTRTIERVDPSWITAVARISDGSMGAIAGRWIDLVEEELGMLPREEKPWIRDLAGQVVAFCRSADAAPDVLFAWSL